MLLCRQDRKPLVALAEEVPGSLKAQAEASCVSLEKSMSHEGLDLMQAGENKRPFVPVAGP